MPELDGHFFYSDFCRGWLRSFKFERGRVVDETEWELPVAAGNVTSFAVDGFGEMYLLTLTGDVYRIEPVRDPTRSFVVD